MKDHAASHARLRVQGLVRAGDGGDDARKTETSEHAQRGGSCGVSIEDVRVKA